MRAMRGGSMAALSLALLAAIDSAGAEDLPTQVVVRFRDSAQACASCVAEHRPAFARRAGAPSLDDKLAQLGAKAMRPAFPSRNRGSQAAASARSQAEWADSVRRRFAGRARRARAGAEAADLSQVYVIDLPEGADAALVAATLSADPEVVYAHPDYRRTVELVPDDPFFASSGSWNQSYPDLWGLHAIGVEAAWEQSTGDGITVAVVDTGVATGHPDLAANLWVNGGEIPANGVDDDSNGYVDDHRGWDFAGDDNDPHDVFGHGTHVAGTIAAVGDNGRGVVGVSWRSRIMDVQVFDSSGSGLSSVLAQGIVYAAENGADVINCSFGGPQITPVMVDAIETALALGAIVVASAGNSSADVDAFEPAAIPGVIAVSATTRLGETATFSNRGEAISVAAPGVDVLSLRAPGFALGPIVASEYMRLSGTSMAAPHVAGVAALLLAAQPALDAEQVRWHLELNAQQPGSPGFEGETWNPQFGYGIVDAERVFDAPPITSRLRPRRLERHVYADSAGSLGTIDLDLTTKDAAAWSLAAPPWLAPLQASGVGPAQIALDFDTAGHAAGQTLSGVVEAAGPTIEASEPSRAALHLHRDVRVGGELPVFEEATGAFPDFIRPPAMRAASTGSTALVLWHKLYAEVRGAFLDANGTVLKTISFGTMQTWTNFDVVANGDEFLVVWIDYPDEPHVIPFERQVLARRYSATGDLLGEVLIDRTRYPKYHLALLPMVDFDGENYNVIWQRRDIRTADGVYRTRIFVRQLAPDGTPLRKRRRISTRTPQARNPIANVVYACHDSRCIFGWHQQSTRYVAPMVGDRLDHRQRKTLPPLGDTAFAAHDLAPGPGGFVMVGVRPGSCDAEGITFGGTDCDNEVRAFRLGEDGTPLDSSAWRVDQRSGGRIGWRSFVRAAFDGTHTLVSFNRPRASGDGADDGGHVFLARIGAGGSVVDAEQDGLLVSPAATGGATVVTPLGGRVLVAWSDSRNDQSVGHPFGSVYAQIVDP